MLKQVPNIILNLYSLRLIVILNLEIVGCVQRFINNVIIVCRKIVVQDSARNVIPLIVHVTHFYY